MPVLLTSGTESPAYFSAIIGALATLVPGAGRLVITGAGHIPHATHPERWSDTLRAFHETIAGSIGEDAAS